MTKQEHARTYRCRFQLLNLLMRVIELLLELCNLVAYVCCTARGIGRALIRGYFTEVELLMQCSTLHLHATRTHITPSLLTGAHKRGDGFAWRDNISGAGGLHGNAVAKMQR